jgi:hypothetical protein
MKNFVTLIAIALLVTSCSFPVTKTINVLQSIPYGSPQLKKIVIHSFGTERFSGLLGLMKQEGGIYYILLDATGIKLLEAEVKNNGEYIIKNGLKKLTNTSLPEILAQTLRRIYIVEPAELPCSTHFFQKLCRKQLSRDTWIKYSDKGPFTHWSVYSDGGADPLITLSQPWIGLQITLSEIAE